MSCSFDEGFKLLMEWQAAGERLFMEFASTGINSVTVEAHGTISKTGTGLSADCLTFEWEGGSFFLFWGNGGRDIAFSYSAPPDVAPIFADGRHVSRLCIFTEGTTCTLSDFWPE